MRKFSIQLMKLIIAGLVAMLFLSFFVNRYCNSGVHIKNPTAATDYTYQPMRHSTNYNEGFSQLDFDYNGFNNVIIPNRIDTLLMGSSHMAALNVNGDESVAYHLNSEYGLNTYNIGVSGHTIYRIVDNLNNAVRTYPTAQRIIIETDTIQLDADRMEGVVNETDQPIKVYDSGLLFWIQKNISAVKYIYKQVGLWRDADHVKAKSVLLDYTDESYTTTLNSFLSKIRAEAGDKEVIIFYHPQAGVDENGIFDDQTDSDARTTFFTACEANNITFLDMMESFENLYNEQHILAHGFANTAVGYGHLNKYGHAVIADELAKVIQGVDE